MRKYFHIWASLFLILISYSSYQALLGSKGYMERLELEKKLAQLNFEVERLEFEQSHLIEKKKSNIRDSNFLNRETDGNFSEKSSQVLKFRDLELSNDSEETDTREFWLRLWESRTKEEKIPPLDVLRVFHISFSFFLCIGVFLKLKP
ncbi:hypothetical protein [Leptospira sp. GIMC2001]|uniref:hypothetical protein n=1 Tax=Leptospira sp. GIMC2001 TaxID=1513297 RepID=UPI00234965DF|nr:hypothetical protein [Leptospira sp. GIMC2001]WCL48033.1 hypothetical protein O4O04_11965 [Leptospira sp. GIMC2001]